MMALLSFGIRSRQSDEKKTLELRKIHMYLLSLVKKLSWLDVTAEQQEIWLINADLFLNSPACYLKYTLFSSDIN